MFLVDSNVWVALALSKHIHHLAAREWLDRVDSPESVWFCRATQQSFLRLLTNAAVLRPYGNPPLTNKDAWDAYEALAADDRISLRTEEPLGVQEQWKKWGVRRTASPKLWMDAYLAAYALAGGYRMVTTDGAYEQFQGLNLKVLGRR